jgi:hypothetical protein
LPLFSSRLAWYLRSLALSSTQLRLKSLAFPAFSHRIYIIIEDQAKIYGS